MIHNTNNFLISLSVTSLSLIVHSSHTIFFKIVNLLKKKKSKNQIIWFHIIAQRTNSSTSCSLHSPIFICRKCPPFSENMIDLCLWVTCCGLSASILFLLVELCLIASSGVNLCAFLLFVPQYRISYALCVCLFPFFFFCPHFFFMEVNFYIQWNA